MKKRMKRFTGGGGVGDDVRSRAYAWLEEQKLKEAYGDEGESKPAAAKPSSSTSSSTAAIPRVNTGSQNDAKDQPRGRFTDSDADARTMRRVAEDDATARRMQRDADEEENIEKINRNKSTPVTDTGDETERLLRRAPARRSQEAAEAADARAVMSRGQYSPEARAARLQRSAENADRGGMTPQAERAVDAAITAASVVPAARLGLGAVRAGREVATAAAQQARTRAGLGRQFAEGAEDAARATAGAPRTTARDVAAGAREVAARRVEAAKSPAQRARERAEELRRTRGEGMEPMDTGITVPPTIRERAAEAARSAAESGRRFINRMRPEPKLVRGRGKQFGESAEDAAQKGFKKGGKVFSASRGDGIAKRGKTRGRYI
jgi:hypothetical protein